MPRVVFLLGGVVLPCVLLAACSGDDGGGRARDVVAEPDAASVLDGVADLVAPDGAAADAPAVDPAVVWTDPVAGLQWQRVAPEQRMAVDVAAVYCEENQAGLPGLGWHVPSIDELRTLVRGCPGTEAGGACGVTEQCLDFADCWSAECWKCPIGEGPADGCYRDADLQGDCGATWTVDPVGGQAGRGWFVNFQRGGVHHDILTVESIVRCVRWY